jgi:hypothetical protein
LGTEWIEIIDTAVKIGLGALISGFTTYHVTQLKNKHENDQVKSSAFRDLILEAAKKCG